MSDRGITEVKDDFLVEIREALKEQSAQLMEIEKTLSVISTSTDNDRLVIDSLKHTVWGNGSIGLDKRVDRLEGSSERALWWLRSVLVAVIALVANVIYKGIEK